VVFFSGFSAGDLAFDDFSFFFSAKFGGAALSPAGVAAFLLEATSLLGLSFFTATGEASS
jgi:hypothetical protein